MCRPPSFVERAHGPPPPPPFDLPLTILAFRERFKFDLAVTDLFADFSVYEDMTRSFNGTVAFLATYREARNGNTYVPAWVNFDGTELPLYF